ncbi:MAG TPA: hypothetical protein VMV94_03915, partial [Phycisphaerae bacterium]|nr:hypothetical protein [Phycisphaerae bacterium]
MKQIQTQVVLRLLAAAMLTLLSGFACTPEDAPFVDHRADTPGLWFSAFRLPEADWGKPDDVLAMSWYMSSEMNAYAWYSFIWCDAIRVLHPDDRSLYHIPNEPMRLRTYFMPVVPDVEKQRYPMVCVLNAKGTYGIYHRESEGSVLEWYRFQDAPRLRRAGSNLIVKPPRDPTSVMSADATLGCLACYLLNNHIPSWPHPRDPSQRHVLIREEDAKAISDFIERHPESFEQITRLLWARLARHYADDSAPKEGEYWSWSGFARRYELRVPIDRDFMICVLPEREQMLLLGTYVKPVKPFDPVEEDMRLINGIRERSKRELSGPSGQAEVGPELLSPSGARPANHNERSTEERCEPTSTKPAESAEMPAESSRLELKNTGEDRMTPSPTDHLRITGLHKLLFDPQGFEKDMASSADDPPKIVEQLRKQRQSNWDNVWIVVIEADGQPEQIDFDGFAQPSPGPDAQAAYLEQ